MFLKILRTSALPILVLFVALISGCGSSASLSNFEKITEGMSKSEVEAILGPGEVADRPMLGPGSKTVTNEELVWKNGELKIRIQFQDGKVGSRRYGKD